MASKSLHGERSSLSGEDLLSNTTAKLPHAGLALGDSLSSTSSSTANSPVPQADGNLATQSVEELNNIVFPTGHQISINLDGQSIDVSDIHGRLQASILITNDGPEVLLSGGTLQLESTENISVRSKNFRIETEEETQIYAGGNIRMDTRCEVRVTAEHEVFVRGSVIWLN